MRVPAESAKPLRLRPGSVALAAFLSSCGAGTAAVLAGQGGGGAGTLTAISAFTVLEPRQSSAAQVRFTLSQPAAVELHYRLPGGADQDLEAAVIPTPLASGTWSIPWKFDDEDALTADFQPGVLVYATIPGILEEPREGANALTIDLGNDAPTITVDTPPAEVDGVVPISLLVGDSSDEVVSVRVEFDDGSGWRAARPGGLGPADPTPEFVSMPVSATKQPFFWDSDFDLPQLERSVIVRVTPRDDLLRGASDETAPFVVDNNAAPIAQLDSGSIVINPDQRRGIPIPVRVLDEEGDAVELILQWRRRGEEFPALPTQAAALDALLANLAERADHHVCTSYPRYASGRVVAVDERHVRLPELAADQAWMLAAGLGGQTLELLRPSLWPQPITPSWSTNPLAAPVAALPLGDGLHALVLDAPGGGRLRELELATGAVREIVSLGSGLPTALALERPREEFALVAIDDAGTWRLERVELASGTRTTLVLSEGTLPAPVRGLASLGTRALVFTVADRLLRLDYDDPLATRLVELLHGLATPTGIALDPLRAGRLYVAEREAPTAGGTGRVLSFDPTSGGVEPVVVDPAASVQLERPVALALQRNGARLLALSLDGAGNGRLVGLDLGRSTRPFSVGDSMPGAASLAAGPEQLLLVASPGTNELHVGGGVEQRRVIAAYDLPTQPGQRSRQLVTLDVPFAPLARPGQPWRIPYGSRRHARPEGLDTTFLWDSADAHGDLSGNLRPEIEVFLRAVPRDDELGTAGLGAAPKVLHTTLDVEPVTLGSSLLTDGPSSVVAADLDLDGDVDLACANRDGNSVTVFYRDAAGAYPLDTLEILGGPGLTDGPSDLAVGDFDGDGSVDLAVANSVGNNVRLFLRDATDYSTGTQDVLGSEMLTTGPEAVVALDLDADGDLDLATANQTGDSLTLFFRGPAGFDTDLHATLTGVDGPVGLAHGDLDGNGHVDLVSANASNVALFLQSSGGWAAPEFFPVSSPAAIALADLDRDGDLDLAATDDTRVVLFFQGETDFEDPVYLGGSEQGLGGCSALALTDLDADGDNDVVVTVTGNGGWQCAFLQRSAGLFDPTALPLDPAPGIANSDPTGISARDLDGDGDLDLVSANRGSDGLALFVQESSSSIPRANEVFEVNEGASVVSMDLSGDGDLDLVAARGGINLDKMDVFTQETPGSFDSARTIDELIYRPFTLTVFDLDGDGNVDLASANLTSNNLALINQGGDGALQTAQVLAGHLSPRRVEVADLDNDGLPDLASSDFDGDRLQLYYQDSSGFSSAPDPLTGIIGPAWVVAADLDGDELLDLAVANQVGDNLAIFFQVRDSPRSFAAPLLLGNVQSTNGAHALVVADLDGDGDLDLASANKDRNNLAIFFQTSVPRIFSTPVLRASSAISGPEAIAAADFDGDGDIDLLLANTAGNNLALFRQDSPGHFATTPEIWSIPSPNFLSAADLDGDGDPDLAVMSRDQNLRLLWGGR